MNVANEEGRIPVKREGEGRAAKRPPAAPDVSSAREAEDVDWRDAAMRLKAEMDNYRKRQRRWAEEEAEREKARLLRQFLEVIDNLEQALNHLDPGDAAHQGVQVAYDSILNLLIKEGVERIFAEGRPFNPDLHEAVVVVPEVKNQRTEMQVVEVMSAGYRYNDRVLRPARVVVAKQA